MPHRKRDLLEQMRLSAPTGRESIVTALKEFLLRQQASLTVLLLATILILAALVWMGYDLKMISKAFIGNGGDTLANSLAVYQALDNLLHRPFNLGYSTIFYGERDSF